MAREFRTGYKVTGDSSGGVRAAQATRSALDKLNTSIEKQTTLGKFASGGMSTYVARIAGVATVAAGAVTGMFAFAKSVADQGDHVQKLSRQLGTSTEFISGMGYAADLSGSSLDSFATSTRKMEKSITDLGDGLSTQVRAFDRLGLTFEDLKRLSPEQQFLTIADRMAAMEDPTKRTATAMDIFGSSVAELVPLLSQGSAGIDAMRAEAERLGLVMSEDFANASAQFNDDLTRSAGVMTGIKREIGEGLLPELDALLQSFVDSADGGDAWVEVGTVLGNTVRVLTAAFVALEQTVVITAGVIASAAKVIAEEWQAIAAPITEFVTSAGQAIRSLAIGDFSAAADAFDGLGQRIADSFKKHASQMKKDLQELGGKDVIGQVSTAFEKVNDILTRQAVVAQGAAGAMENLGGETGKSAIEADKAAKAFESLADKLDPLAKLQRQFTVDQAILAGKIAEGGDQLAYYSQLLDILKEQYAENAREAVGFGDKAIAAAEKAAKATENAAQREAAARRTSWEKQQIQFDTFATAFRRGIERLDDLGAGLWQGWFTGAKSAMQSIKDYFLNWLAELANAAITRPILVSIVASLGLSGSATASAANALPGIAGIPGLGNVNGLSDGGSGLGGIGGIGSLFTGTGIGQAFAGLPSWLGGSAAANLGPTYGISQGGLFGNAAGVSNLAFGIAGILGGILGDKIFGGYGGIGGSLGAVIGTAILPGIGSVIGGVLGGALGGLFGAKNNPPKLSAAGTAYAAQSPYASGHDLSFETALGDVFIRSKRIADEDIATLQSSITDFDAAVASILTDDQLAEAGNRLKNWSSQMEGAAISVEDLIKGRWGIVLSTLSSDIQEYVKEFAGLPEQIQRAALATTAQRIIDAAPDLFAGRTFRDFITAAEGMQQSGEELTDTFQRLADQVVQIANQLTLVKGYAASDLLGDFNTLMEQQGYTLLDLTTNLGDQIRDLASSFTGSADDLTKLSTLVSQRYDSEIAYLSQIKQISDGISAGFQNLKDQINHDLLGDQGYYDQITAQAEKLAQDLKSMTDPAKIASTVAEIQRLTGTAYGLLDQQGKATNGQGFLDFISGVEDTAQGQLDIARDLFTEQSQVLRDLVTEMADSFADPLTIAAEAHEQAATDLSQSASELSGAASALGSAAGGLVGAVRAGLSGITDTIAGLGNTILNGAGASGTVPAVGSTGITSQDATLIATTVANAVLQAGKASTGAVLQAGQASALAILKAGNNVQLQVVEVRPGMVNT